jgi:hypothetical protein
MRAAALHAALLSFSALNTVAASLGSFLQLHHAPELPNQQICEDLTVNLTVPEAKTWWGDNSQIYANWSQNPCNQTRFDYLDLNDTIAVGVHYRYFYHIQHLIECPRKNESEFTEFFIVNKTQDYCGPVQIRTCNDANGCVGVKYRNNTETYGRCSPEYMNIQPHCEQHPCNHEDWHTYAQLPARVRIDPDTKYLVFVCDPEPGVKAPVVQEYWGYLGNNATLPPMAQLDCRDTYQDSAPPYSSRGWHPFHCPWVEETPHINRENLCDACTDCRPRRPNSTSYGPNMYNLTINNSKMDVTWRIDLLMGPSWPPVGPVTTCAWGEGYRGEGTGELSPFIGPDADQYLVPPYSTVHMAIPPGVTAIHGIPMYTTGVRICVLEEQSGFQHILHMDSTNGTYPNGGTGCIDSDWRYPYG